jgi:hypothetical protein
VFGIETRYAILQNTAHGVERSEDDDSISRVCGSHCRLQGLDRVREGPGLGVRACIETAPLGLQAGAGLRTRGGEIGEIPAVDDGVDPREHGRQVLVGHGTKHRVGGGEKTHGVQVGRQCRHRMRVVRHVQHQRRLARHDLEAPGQLHHRQAGAHGLGRDRQALAQGNQRGQHPAGIHQLVGTAQGRVGHAAVTPAAPAPSPIAACRRKVEIHAQTPQVGPLAAWSSTLCGGTGSLTTTGLPVRMMPAFSRPMAFAVGPSQLHVVQVDAGDDGAVGIDDVDGIQPPTQPHLQHGHIQLGT